MISRYALETLDRDKLSDHTRIAGKTWKQIKPEAMKDNFNLKDWCITLTSLEKALLEALITAQNKQGNMEELQVQDSVNQYKALVEVIESLERAKEAFKRS